MIKAAIFILTQNNIERKVYLKTTLYFLFKNFNSIYKYPVIIFHEGDYDDKSQKEIIYGIREECRHLISFKELDKTDFTIPDHIDKDKMKKSIESAPVPYWRNDKYRSMCRWWSINVWKYTEGYEYIMRIDDDSIIEEKITEDLFDLVKAKEYVFISNFVHVDCGVCCYGFKDLLLSLYPAKTEQINSSFINSEIEEGNEHFEKIKKLYEIVEEKQYDKNKFTLPMPVMFYNNFFVTEVSFWKRNDVRTLLDIIDKKGLIHYYRLGDAPIMTLVSQLIGGTNKVSRIVFKYSKRLQREIFIDDKGNMNSFMPKKYSQSSCITDR